MQLTLTGKHLAVTEALSQYAHEKLQKLQRFSNTISRIHIIFHTEHHKQCVEARMIAHGVEHYAEVEHEDMYAALDFLKKKLAKQLLKDKAKQELAKAVLRQTKHVPPEISCTEPPEAREEDPLSIRSDGLR